MIRNQTTVVKLRSVDSYIDKKIMFSFQKNFQHVSVISMEPINLKLQKKIPNCNPSVILQGQVIQLMGPLQIEEGDQALFEQLYILDGNMETNERIGNMNMPNNISLDDQNTLMKLFDCSTSHGSNYSIYQECQ